MERFNPCCIGLAIAAQVRTAFRQFLMRFNPCCIGLAIAARWLLILSSARSWCFNPCCIGLAIAASHQRRLPGRNTGFNPCCIGLAIAAASYRHGLAPPGRFQSLLYWISHCGNGFLAVGELAIGFQSLLYWISHCGKNKR